MTEEEKEQITGKLSEASNWMDEEGYTAGTKELKEKLSELRKLCKAMFFRVEERKKWPDRLAALDSMLNHSSIFLKLVRASLFYFIFTCFIYLKKINAFLENLFLNKCMYSIFRETI